ncbi:MAG: hypothetical protein AAF399_26125 [Bacteroidota bacterium]
MNFRLLIAAALFGFASLLSVKAQVDDTLIFFKIDPTLLIPENLGIDANDMNGPWSLMSMSKLKPVSVSAAKKLSVPRSVKTSSTPIVLRRDGKCYEFGCKAGNGCNSCQLVWYDRNGDGKVQPRKELRCVCGQGDQCKIRVRKVPCQ